MAIDAGTLEIKMMMGLARITEDIAKLNNIVGGGMKGVESAVASAKNALGALGVGLGVGALVLFSKHTIDAIENMKSLAEEAGTTASAMSKFEAPARSAGLGLDSVANAMFKMSKAALEAKDPSSKAAQALAAIGISTAQLKGLKPDEMFELVARQLGKYNEGLERNAVVQELFGKSGREMNRVISEIASGGQLVATVTDEEAAAAKRFNDQLLELKMSSEKTWRSLASEGLPALNDIMKKLVEAAQGAGLFKTAVIGLVGIFGGDLTGALGAANTKANELYKQIFALEQTVRNAPSRSLLGENYDAYIKRITDQIAVLRQQLAALNAPSATTTPAGPAKPDPKFDPAAAARAAAAAAAALAADKKYWEDFRKLEGEQEMRLLDEQEKFVKAYTENMDKLRRDALQAEVDDVNARGDVLDALKDRIEQLKIENATLDMTDAARKLYLIGLEREKALKNADEADVAKINRYYDEIAVLNQVGDAHRQQIDAWDQMSTAAGNFFGDLVMNGKSAFDNLKTQLKGLLQEMIALFAKRWILNMAAGGSVMGSAGDAASTVMGGGPGSSLLGTGISMGANYLATAAGFTGLGTASTFVGAASGAIPAAAIGADAVAAGVGVNSAAAAAGSAMSGVYTALAAIPVWGWIAMAVVAIGVWIAGNHKGGDKVGGSFFTGGAVPGTDNGRFFTPNQGDTMLQEQVLGLQAGYGSLAARLGGTAGNFGFGVGFDHDPQGTAQSRVSSMLTGPDGAVLYANLNRSMDDKEVPAQIALELKRQLLAALQATNLDEHINSIFDSITDIASATGEEIDAILAQALEMRQVLDGLTALNANGLDVDALQAWQREGETLGQTFQRVAGQFAAFNDAFMSDAQKLEATQAFVTSTFANLGIAIPESTGAFYDLVQGLDLGTESGRHMFEILMQVAPAFQTVEHAAASAVATFNSLASSLSPAFGASNARGVLEASVGSWRGLGNNAERTTEQTIQDIANLITSGQIGSALTYAQALGGNAVNVLNAMLSAYQAWQQSLNSGATSVAQTFQPATTAIGAMTDAAARAASSLAAYQAIASRLSPAFAQQLAQSNFDQALTAWRGVAPEQQPATMQWITDWIRDGRLGEALAYAQSLGGNALDLLTNLLNAYDAVNSSARALADSLANARLGLGDYLSGLLLGDKSPLDPTEKLREAQLQYERMLALAQGGDLAGIQGLQGAHSAYIDIARQLFGSSSPFIEIFERTFNEVAGVAGVADYNTQMLTISTTTNKLLENIAASSLRVEQLLDYIASTTAESGEKVANAVENSAVELR